MSNNVHLVTGMGLTDHITSANDRALRAGIVGSGRYVVNRVNKLEARVSGGNTIEINTGDVFFNGSFIQVEAPTILRATNGGQSPYFRKDMIYIKYTKTDGGIEDAELLIEDGSPITLSGSSINDAQLPSPEGYGNNILDGVDVAVMPLYAVNIEGFNVKSIDKLFMEYTPHVINVVTELPSNLGDDGTIYFVREE